MEQGKSIRIQNYSSVMQIKAQSGGILISALYT